MVPNKVTKIGKNAFRNDSSLIEITVPKSVKEIEENAFTDIENLTISGVEGSYVAQYASENKIVFNAVEIPDDDWVHGDLDSDGKVSLQEVVIILKAALGIENLSDEDLEKADFDEDGSIKLSDAQAALKAALGIDK